jgi:hypothetical protein
MNDPTTQWSRLEAGRSDDIGSAGRGPDAAFEEAERVES